MSPCCPRCSKPLDAPTPSVALVAWALHMLFERDRCIGCARPGGTTLADLIVEERMRHLQ